MSAAHADTPAEDRDVLSAAVRGTVLRQLVRDYATHLAECEPEPKSDWVTGFRAARSVIGEQLTQFVDMIDEMPIP